jgi:nucleoid-associated protein YgaU
MRRTGKLGLAALLLAGGISTASLFRRQAPQTPSAHPAAELVLRRDDTPRPTAASTSAPDERPITLPASLMPPDLPPLAKRQPTRRKRRQAESSVVSPAPFAWADPPPPDIKWEYPGAQSAPERSWNSSQRAAWPRLAADDWRDDPEATPSDDESAGGSHVIVDGDTLESLAQRYLGAADRADELFHANRDVLSDPQLLPIGAMLRIPARRVSRQPLVPVSSTEIP